MTLRELLWASNAKEQAEWVRSACMTARVLACWGGERDPQKLLPDWCRPGEERQRALTPEEQERESAIAWRLLEQGLRAG